MNRIPKFSEAFAIAAHAAAELAIAAHAAAELANAPKRRTQLQTLAENYRVSRHHLAKVMARLGRAGLVRSERGPDGGYQLARSPDTISLLDVFEAIEGPLDLAPCLFDQPVCNGRCCLFGNVLAAAASQIRAYMAETTLAQAAACFTEMQPPVPAPPPEETQPCGTKESLEAVRPDNEDNMQAL